ncbi:MAG: carbohydrate binding family 9 domain-containing protein [Acidobacteria bacterium]|nr:carbohydrate binding family 9 domain-containing protein [Acidobacteriota bacterium]
MTYRIAEAGAVVMALLGTSQVFGAMPRPGAVAAAVARMEAAPLPEATAIRLDAELSDRAWQTAPVTTEFVQREPREGAAPTLKTELRVAYDRSNLYVAIRAFDPEPSRIVGHLTRRDVWSPSDWLRVFIDSYHDRRTAYEFGVNPAGVKQDKYWFNDGNQDESWDAVWDVAVAIDGEGWRAEFRVPLSQLRFNPNAGDTFGFAVTRYVARFNETATWPLLPRGASGFVSSFGELGGLSLGRSTKRLELLPYGVAEVKTSPRDEGNPLADAVNPSGSMGLDLKFAVTPGLTLTSTINPDFGQVEADPAVVNLTAFETFFSERRPFFVEGSGVFRFDVDCGDGECTGLFYSRRIGRPPQGAGDLPSGDGIFTAAPTQSTIVGAAKLTGRVKGFSVGALYAVTPEERASIVAGSLRTTAVVEPATSYSVVRARKEFRDQSSVGFMTTATNRQISSDVQFLPGSAYTGGIDWDWRLGRRYSLGGYWAGSTVRGDVEAVSRLQQNNRHSFQRPDASHVELDPTRTSLDGHSGRLAFSKIAGERVRFNSNIGFKSPGYEINDLGFLRRADERTVNNWIQFRDNTPSKHVRTFILNLNQYAGWNYGGDLLWSGGNVNAHATFTNNWRIGGGYNLNHQEFDDRLTRGGPGGLTAGYRTVWTYVNGDDRQPVVFNGFLGFGSDGHGSSFRELGPYVTVRPKSFLSLSAGIRFDRRLQDSQWVEAVTDADGGTHYAFGRLDQTTVAFTGRVNYTILPTLSIQVYAEPFVSAGDYSKFKELVQPRARRYEDRYATFGYGGNPDFNYKSFRTTNVLRWEYKPGSALFIVWQQAREDTVDRGDFRFGHDFGDVFGVAGTNVFLVKLSYWLNY